MASAKRRSEIHALSIEDSHLRFDSSDGSVTLLCQSGFLAKNQLPSMASKPFKVPSLSRTCGHEDDDRLLCPVRALKFYLKKSLVIFICPSLASPSNATEVTSVATYTFPGHQDMWAHGAVEWDCSNLLSHW
ncbi:hypothetical protein DPMN_075376 [Dreissena polymorpha]|uniref:Uncharacterized protein n=1 Tax=Dreissena polymorpha TaxID=45954 RepID=A0A9D3YK91_DREPO|nr:hypothetical protein DPMN_075376 [Dreissena polymorpha]